MRIYVHDTERERGGEIEKRNEPTKQSFFVIQKLELFFGYFG